MDDKADGGIVPVGENTSVAGAATATGEVTPPTAIPAGEAPEKAKAKSKARAARAKGKAKSRTGRPV